MEYSYMNEEDDSTYGDPLSEDENEDINLAIELSILESKRTKTTSAGEQDIVESSYEDKEEQLAGALQGTNKNSHKSRQRITNTAGTTRRWWRKFSSSLNFMKKFKYLDVTSWISYRKRDFSYQTNLVCDVCDEPIYYDWLTRPYWGQTLCFEHSSDGTPMCCSCSRFKLGNTSYINLSDGRKLCPDCHCTAIMDPEKCIPLVREVYRFFEGLNMEIIKDIPIFLVDKHEMDKLHYKRDNKNPQNVLLGLTTLRAEVVTIVSQSSQRGQNVNVVKEVQYIPRIYEVTSMLILYGYPKLAIGATLAHEMMHAWMRVEGYRGVRREVEEGICEVMAHRWLDWYAFIGDDFLCSSPEQAQFLRNLKEFLKNEIERNYCMIYGGGFRDAKWAVERFGLKYTLIHIAQTGNFPQ